MNDAHSIDPRTLDILVADPGARLHFTGVGGSGMSALAQYRIQGGGRASGSDRSFDRGEAAEARAYAERLGISIFPQDGSGVDGAALVVASTAVESTIADVVRAREAGVPVILRAELLASHVRTRPTIAVAGTSGKSTVTAMLFEALTAIGANPGVIGGGDLLALKSDSDRGNARFGGGPLVVEADESDKSLVRYRPHVGVLLNLQKDHDLPEAFIPVFDRYRQATTGPFVASDDENLARWQEGSLLFGFSPRAAVRAEAVELLADGSRFRVEDQEITLPIPGRHNVANALAAIAAVKAWGGDWQAAARALGNYRGVARRFQTLGRAGGVEVIDDFAHNPAKIEATMIAAVRRASRVLAVFSPHGFAPMRLMGDDIVEVFARTARPTDRVYFPEIFFAGGSAVRDVSSGDFVEKMRDRGVAAEFVPARRDLVLRLAQTAAAGDLILLMGARDPSLPEFAAAVLRALEARFSSSPG